jgi:GTP-binding protein
MASQLYRRACFLLSATSQANLPPDNGLEVAFAGRSNAGKSSAINVITGIGSLARTSKTPGRTQQINFFDLDGERYLVDLPGYGYAKVPEAMRRHWGALIGGYLQARKGLRGVVLVMDIRHPVTPHDTQLLDWCQAAAVPTLVLLTKSDKLKRGPGLEVRRQVAAHLAQSYGATVEVQLFSAPTRNGAEEARAWLDLRLEVSDGQKKAPDS